MGSLVASSSLSQSPLASLPFSPSRRPFSSSSSSSLSPLPLRPLDSSTRKATEIRTSAGSSCGCGGDGDLGGCSKRRAFLLSGISVLPLLQLEALAACDPLHGPSFMSNAIKLPSSLLETSSSPCIASKPCFKGFRQFQLDKSTRQNRDIAEPQRQDIEQPKPEIPLEEPSKPDVADMTKPLYQGPEQPELEISTQKSIKLEKENLQDAPRNTFLSLLNGIGILGAGVLGALYAISQKEKTAVESSIAIMTTKLTEKEVATSLLKDNYGRRLEDQQEEHKKQARRFKEEETSLLNQFASATRNIASLQKELDRERNLIEELEAKTRELVSKVARAAEDKKMLEAKLKEKMNTIDVLQDKVSLLSLEISDKEKNIDEVKLSLSWKEEDYKSLSSVLDQTSKNFELANSKVERLEAEILGLGGELNTKMSTLDSLNEKVRLLNAEKVDAEERVGEIMNEHSDLKSTSEARANRASELLCKKDDELRQLELKLGIALSEAVNGRTTIAELKTERDGLKIMLESEMESTGKLKDELRSIETALEDSRIKVFYLSKELGETKKSQEELLSRISMTEDEFSKVKKALTSELNEVRSVSEALSDELVLIKETRNKRLEELRVNSDRLTAIEEDRDIVKKELMGIYKKLESTAHELKEERDIAAGMKRELEVLLKQVERDSEARRALEADLDEATKSLNEMNKSALLLSRELENTNARTGTLETEKEMLLRALTEQKNLSKEARENLEDAQNFIMRLGSEGENWERKSKKQEEELAVAKGEILRLRRGVSMSGGSPNERSVNEDLQKTNQVTAGTPFSAKKNATRRRKGDSTS